MNAYCASSIETARPASNSGLRLLSLALIFLLASCSVVQNPADSGSSADFDSVLEDSDAPQLLELDDILADNSLASLRNQPDLALVALQAAVYEQRWESASQLLELVEPTQYRGDALARYTQAACQYWLHSGEYIRAKRWLDNVRLQNELPLMSARNQILISLARAEVLFQLGDYQASAQERIFIESLLTDPAQQQANAQAIWQTLLKTPVSMLKQQQRRAVDQSSKAWLELAIIQHNNEVDNSEQAKQVQAWRARWPDHNAALNLPTSIATLQQLSSDRPRSIAALLPLTGSLADGGKAVQDGLAAAYFNALAEGWELPQLHFYNTDGQPIDQLYQQAVAAGADLIIGPLQKDKVSEFLTMPTQVPIITLNYLANGMPPPLNVIQFGLAAEDEAIQLAHAARIKNYRNALILQSSSDWSRRASDAFIQQWQADDGVVLSNTILSVPDNYSKEIESSLLLPDSQQRLQRIQNIIGQTMEFTPRRRNDIDIIILFANSKQAKRIKPLLSYHYAGRLPVYSSSHVNDGVKKRKNNRDLNGIVFNEIPWVLSNNKVKKQAAKRYQNSKNLGRLFAMGVDAFYLHPRIQQLQQSPDSALQGLTGTLTLSNNRIVRELQLARFSDGKVEASR